MNQTTITLPMGKADLQEAAMAVIYAAAGYNSHLPVRGFLEVMCHHD